MNRKATWFTALILFWTLGASSLVWGAAGTLQWQKSFNFLPDYDMIFPSVTFSSTLCIAFGQAQKSDYSAPVLGFIKVFDLATGNLKWERTLSLGANDNYFGNIVIDGNIVYMQSSASSYTDSYNPGTETTDRIFTLNQTIFGAYDANTGNPIWQEARDQFSGYMAANPGLPRINNHIVMVGSENQSGFGPTGDCVVSVYQAKNLTFPAISNLLLDQ
jgi:outer membrane protein assembly factor BamB